LSVCCAEAEEMYPKQAQIEAKSIFLIMGYWFKFSLTMVDARTNLYTDSFFFP